MSGPFLQGKQWKATFSQEWHAYESMPTTRFDALLKIEREMEEEAALRARYPALQSAWDHYQVALKMCQASPPDDDLPF